MIETKTGYNGKYMVMNLYFMKGMIFLKHKFLSCTISKQKIIFVLLVEFLIP